MKILLKLFLILPLIVCLFSCNIKESSKNEAKVVNLDVPTISIEDEKLHIDRVTNANYYTVVINDEIFAKTTNTTIDLSELKEGTYHIMVRACSSVSNYDNSDYSAILTYKKESQNEETKSYQLDAPAISINDNIVTWNKVKNATSYIVYINDIAIATSHSNSYALNLSEDGKYEIKVKARSSDSKYEKSNFSNTVVYVVEKEIIVQMKLNAPSLVIVDDMILWSKIENASYYKLYINDQMPLEVTGTSYSLPHRAGTYMITIKAMSASDKYMNSDYSNTVTYVVQETEETIVKIQLSKPNISLANNTISWDKVDHADKYDIYINNNTPITITGTSYNLSNKEPGTYIIKVKALSFESKYLESDYSNILTVEIIVEPDPIELIRLASPVIKLENNVISWNVVQDATYYKIYINSESSINISGTSYTITKQELGTYVIKVKACSSNSYHIDSNYSNSVTYKIEPIKLNAPTISIDDNIISWNKVNNANQYKIYIDGTREEFVNETSYEIITDVVGIHTFKIKAISNDNRYLDSDYSNEVSYEVKEYLPFTDTVSSLTRVGQYGEVIGMVERTKPQESNGGLAFYPEYMVNLTDKSLNQEIYDENTSLIASNTTYNSMDKDGNLYLDGVLTGQKLYKHTASNGLYGGNVSDDEVAVSKKIKVYSPRPVGNYITGLYAPAGEVIKIEISEEDLRRVGTLNVYIGLTAGRGQTNDMVSTVTYNRMPRLQNVMSVTSPTTYVGSYLGGPIYILTKNSVPFEVTISGAVEYLHYIDGMTSEEEFNRLLETSAPYLDVEVYDTGFRFSGPRYTTYGNDNPYDYDNLVKVMKMWQNLNMTSRSVPHGMNSSAYISMTFDTYVPNGYAALAIVGADYAKLPVSWMRGTLGYETFMKNGAWGSIHEFNHHFQKFGCNGNNNEVSNNILNYCEYILYTRLTEYRNYTEISSHELGLDSHYDIEYLNQYRDSTSTQLNTEKGYAILVQNFGPELMLEVFRNQNGITTVDEFYKSLCNTIKMDFTFFIEELWHLDVTDSLVEEIKTKNYPTYVPLGSFYSSSFNIKAINNESLHALPYICNKELIIDFDEDINTVTGYNVEILEVSMPTKGSLTHISNHIYKYVATTDDIASFTVRVRVYNDTYSEEVTITYDLNPINQGVEVITYKYDSMPYANIVEAYDNDFAGYTSVTTKYQTGQRVNGASVGTVVVAKGKFMVPEDGIYQVCYMGGRGSSMLYASVNNQDNFEKIGYILINQSGYMLTEPSYAYKEMELHKGDIVYYIEYLLPTSNNAYLEIGMGTTNLVSDVKKVDDSLFRGMNGSYDYVPNYDLRNDNYASYDYDLKALVPYDTLHASSPNFKPWDNNANFALDKIFDGNSSTYAHSQRNYVISETNFIDLIISCDNTMYFNAMTLYGTGSSQTQLPITFDLYIKVDGEYQLLKSYSNLTVSSNQVKLVFDNLIETDEIKLHITDTNPNYLALSNIEIFDYTRFNVLKCEDIKYYGNISVDYIISPNGHVYTLNTDSYLEYEFTDSISLALKNESESYIITIDDEVVDQYTAYELNDYDIYNFEKSGNHTLKILVNDGSISIYDLLKVTE